MGYVGNKGHWKSLFVCGDGNRRGLASGSLRSRVELWKAILPLVWPAAECALKSACRGSFPLIESALQEKPHDQLKVFRSLNIRCTLGVSS